MRTRFNFLRLLLSGSMLLALFAWQASVTYNLSAEDQVLTAATNAVGGALRTEFPLNYGKVEVNLPDDMCEEDTLTGTVIVDPAGKSDKARQKKLDSINSCTLEVNNKQIPIHGGAIALSLPKHEPVLKMVLKNEFGKVIYTARIPVNPPAPACPSTPPTDADYTLPTCGVAHNPVQCRGRFNGTFSDTQVSIDGTPQPLYCESPRQVVFCPPTSFAGPARIRLKEGKCVKDGVYNNLTVAIHVVYPHVYTGQSTPVTVRVDGLLGVKKPIALRITNTSPGVFRMEGGDTQIINILPGNSFFETTLTAKAVNAGQTTFTASVDL